MDGQILHNNYLKLLTTVALKYNTSQITEHMIVILTYFIMLLWDCVTHTGGNKKKKRSDNLVFSPRIYTRISPDTSHFTTSISSIISILQKSNSRVVSWSFTETEWQKERQNIGRGQQMCWTQTFMYANRTAHVLICGNRKWYNSWIPIH